MADDDTTLLAGRLAEMAYRESPDALEAVQALAQAAGAICLTRMKPASFGLAAFDGAHHIIREKLVEVDGPGRTRH